MTTAPILELINVSAGYRDLTVLHEVSLRVKEGEFVAVVGPNGHGKTTLLRAITGLVSRSNGEIRFAGTNLPDRTSQIASMGIAHIPQGDMLFSQMSVYENLLMGAYITQDKAHIQRRLEEVFTLLPRLAERRRQVAASLSGGERRMVGIGRGLMMGGRLLLIDEPSLGLAPLVIEQIYEVISALSKAGRTILLVEENPARIEHIADTVHLLDDGAVIWSGEPIELMARDELLATYLGG